MEKGSRMTEPTETEPERARLFWSMSLSAFGAELERETFEKACKATCPWCDMLGMPRKVVDESRHGMPHKPSTGVSEWWHGGAYCRATPIRNAFPHLAKQDGK